MKTLLTAAAAMLALSAPVFADSHSAAGDAEAGEKAMKKCKACHMVSSEDEVFLKGGKTGPNLYGVVGRVAGSVEDFKYGPSLKEAGEKGLVWDTANLAEYVADPKGFLADYLDDGAAKSKMTFKLRKGGEDVAAYLASVSPAAEADAEAESDMDADGEETKSE